MNISDVEKVTEYPQNITHAIFLKQHELAIKYHPIEAANGLLQTHDFPANMNCKFGQARFKDLCWRAMEELGEALDSKDMEDSLEHFHEELADGLHFLVEAALTAGLMPIHFVDNDLFRNEMEYQAGPISEINHYVANFVTELGMTCNHLKNKPWKTSHMLTDLTSFKDRLMDALSEYVVLCKCAGLTVEDLYDLYFRKHEVNKFRQRSGY